MTGGYGPLSRASAALPGSDFLTRLPIELHILVLENLDPTDVYNALNASKNLRRLWLSEDIWPWLAQTWYPGFFQTVQAEAAQQSPTTVNLGTGSQNPAQNTLNQVAPSELFRRMLGQICRRNDGKYASALHHNMQFVGDTVFSLSQNVPLDQGGLHSTGDFDEDMLLSAKSNTSRFMVYRHGRIAWWPNPFGAPFIAIVDDLRTARRKVYRFPNHSNIQRGYRTAMSDKVLVIARDNILHAWHLEKDLLASIAIPEPFERCIADGTTVLIVTRSAQLYSWKFGGSLERIDISGFPCYQPGPVRLGGLDQLVLNQFLSPRRQGLRLRDNGMLLDFILHPYLEGVLFVVTMLRGDLVVHEVDHDKPMQSYPLHSATSNSVESWNEVSEYLRWERCDSYGGYCLFSMYLSPSDELSPYNLQSPGEPFCACEQDSGIVSICFNIYTKAYKIVCHHLLPSHSELRPVTAAFHLWNDKLYTSYAVQAMQSGMPITALRCCIASQNWQNRIPPDNIPVYSASVTSKGVLTRRKRTYLCPERISNWPISAAEQETWQCLMDFGLDVPRHHASTSVGGGTLWNWGDKGARQLQAIVGDDGFLIYIVDGVYAAWSFGDGIPVPKKGVTWTPWRRV